MARRALSDPIWEQLQATMKAKGCHRWSNDRQVMEAILWKLRTDAPWRDTPREFCPWKTAYNRFNRWAAKGLWADFFLSYEAKLIRSGYSPMEVTSALISMRVELGVEKNAVLENPGEELPPSFMLPPMRMKIRSVLKSLGVRSTIPKLRSSSSQK